MPSLLPLKSDLIVASNVQPQGLTSVQALVNAAQAKLSHDRDGMLWAEQQRSLAPQNKNWDKVVVQEAGLVAGDQGALTNAHVFDSQQQAMLAKVAHDQNGLLWAQGQADPPLVHAERALVQADQGALRMLERAIGSAAGLRSDGMTKQSTLPSLPSLPSLLAVDNKPSPYIVHTRLSMGEQGGNFSLWGSAGPQPNDVKQGSIGDCYLMASLMALAKADPKLIEDRIKPVAGQRNTWDVLMFQRTPENTYKPIYERVNLGNTVAQLATDNHGASIVWPQIMEAAYAKLHESSSTDANGFGEIGHGGWMFDPLSAFTGNHTVTSFDPKTFEKVLEQNRGPRTALTVSTNDNVGPVGGVANHAYAVLSIVGSGPDAVVTLRNPWGKQDFLRNLFGIKSWKHASDPRVKTNVGGDPAVASMPMSLLVQSLSSVVACPLSANSDQLLLPAEGGTSPTPGRMLVPS